MHPNSRLILDFLLERQVDLAADCFTRVAPGNVGFDEILGFTFYHICQMHLQLDMVRVHVPLPL